jgi:hypothetical protein
VRTKLKLTINVDGVSVYRSVNASFWPILGCIGDGVPFVIALFYGKSKPDLGIFLADFVKETQELAYCIELEKIIADRPARAFMKCIKGHTGYSACDKCTVSGEYDGQVIFDELNASLRTDSNFRQRHDPDHHTSTSPLECLQLDMIRSFPYDYMHLVCLGVMRRLILYWLEGPLRTRFHRQLVEALSANLMQLRDFSQQSLPGNQDL